MPIALSFFAVRLPIDQKSAKSFSCHMVSGVLVQIFLADLILVYWVPRNEGLRA
ncbi:hypothetical protein LCUW1_00028590 [Lactobacillus casei]|nr:hypothetical protein [Lacticaseibacillus casei]